MTEFSAKRGIPATTTKVALPAEDRQFIANADVHAYSRKTVVIDMSVMLQSNQADADEYVITLNGRVLRRILNHQAFRTYHILPDERY